MASCTHAVQETEIHGEVKIHLVFEVAGTVRVLIDPSVLVLIIRNQSFHGMVQHLFDPL